MCAEACLRLFFLFDGAGFLERTANHRATLQHKRDGTGWMDG